LLDEARALLGDAARGDDDVLAAPLQWMDEDRKATPLKTLQGLIWAEGYATGELVGHVYGDALQALQLWHRNGLRLYVYSSGSVAAQRLLFAHTPYGDLTTLFSGFFDTETGSKKEPASYSRIAQAIGVAPEAVLFLSDSAHELDAARAAGLVTAALDREGLGGHPHGHPVFSTFSAIDPGRFS
jgi:enolase-phosphatase E1